MANSITNIHQTLQEEICFTWNFSTSQSPWCNQSPTIYLYNERSRCNLIIQSTFSENGLYIYRYNTQLALNFIDSHSCYPNEIFEVKICFDKDLSNEYIFKLVKSNKNDKQFSAIKFIENPDSLSDASLEVFVTIIYTIDRLQHDNYTTNLVHDFELLLRNESYADLNIEVGDKIFKTHKNILSCRSTVLAKMIETDMVEKRTNKIILWHWESDVVKELLAHIYTGNCNLNGIAHELFKLAHFLDLAELQLQCNRFLLNNVKVENIADILELTDKDQYELYNLKKAAMNFVTANESLCVKNSKFDEYLRNSIKLSNIIFVLRIANTYELKDTLITAMEFVKQNYKAVLEIEETKNFFLSDAKLLLKILQYSLESTQNQIEQIDK